MLRFKLSALLLLLTSLAGFSTSPDYNNMLDSCDYYLSRERWDDAERSIRTCLKMQPASPLNSMLFYNLGMAQLGNMKPHEAEDSFTLAIVKDRYNPKYLLARAKSRIMLIKLPQAQEDLDTILIKDSLNTEALHSRALVCRLTNKPHDAIPYLRRIINLNSEDVKAGLALSEVLIETGDYNEAYAILKDYTSNDDETDSDIRFARMMAMFNLNKDDELSEEIREGIGRYPRDGRYYMMRAALARRNFQNRDAEIDKKRALEFGISPEALSRFLGF